MKYEVIHRISPPTELGKELIERNPEFTYDEKYISKLGELFECSELIKKASGQLSARMLRCYRYNRISRDKLLGLVGAIRIIAERMEKELQ